MLERDVKAAVKKLLTYYGWFHWMPPSNAFGRVGIADINAVKSGRFLAIETKVGKNVPTAPQRLFLTNVRLAGGYAFTINETRIPLLTEWLSVFDLPHEPRLLTITEALSIDPLPPSVRA